MRGERFTADFCLTIWTFDYQAPSRTVFSVQNSTWWSRGQAPGLQESRDWMSPTYGRARYPGLWNREVGCNGPDRLDQQPPPACPARSPCGTHNVPHSDATQHGNADSSFPVAYRPEEARRFWQSPLGAVRGYVGNPSSTCTCEPPASRGCAPSRRGLRRRGS